MQCQSVTWTLIFPLQETKSNEELQQAAALQHLSVGEVAMGVASGAVLGKTVSSRDMLYTLLAETEEETASVEMMAQANPLLLRPVSSTYLALFFLSSLNDAIATITPNAQSC